MLWFSEIFCHRLRVFYWCSVLDLSGLSSFVLVLDEDYDRLSDRGVRASQGMEAVLTSTRTLIVITIVKYLVGCNVRHR